MSCLTHSPQPPGLLTSASTSRPHKLYILASWHPVCHLRSYDQDVWERFQSAWLVKCQWTLQRIHRLSAEHSWVHLPAEYSWVSLFAGNEQPPASRLQDLFSRRKNEGHHAWSKWSCFQCHRQGRRKNRPGEHFWVGFVRSESWCFSFLALGLKQWFLCPCPTCFKTIQALISFLSSASSLV